MWKLVLFSLSLGAFVACNLKSKSQQQPAPEVETDVDVVVVEEVEQVAEQWYAVASESEIMWRGFKPGGEHEGTVLLEKGSLLFMGDNASGFFEVNMKTIHVTDLEGNMKEKLENHLDSPDFFDIEKYPTATFEITGMEMSDNADYPVRLHGNLAIKDSVQSIHFLMKYALVNDTLVAESDRFKIDRTDFGVDYMSKNIIKELKDKFIHDDISLRMKLKFVK